MLVNLEMNMSKKLCIVIQPVSSVWYKDIDPDLLDDGQRTCCSQHEQSKKNQNPHSSIYAVWLFDVCAKEKCNTMWCFAHSVPITVYSSKDFYIELPILFRAVYQFPSSHTNRQNSASNISTRITL